MVNLLAGFEEGRPDSRCRAEERMLSCVDREVGMTLSSEGLDAPSPVFEGQSLRKQVWSSREARVALREAADLSRSGLAQFVAVDPKAIRTWESESAVDPGAGSGAYRDLILELEAAFLARCRFFEAYQTFGAAPAGERAELRSTLLRSFCRVIDTDTEVWPTSLAGDSCGGYFSLEGL